MSSKRHSKPSRPSRRRNDELSSSTVLFNRRWERLATDAQQQERLVIPLEDIQEPEHTMDVPVVANALGMAAPEPEG